MFLVIGIVLLVVNIYSKNSFVTDITSLKTEKTLRNSFSSAKLCIVMLYGYANKPKEFDATKLGIHLDSFDSLIRNFLQYNLDQLHASLSEFGQNQALWDSDFVYLVGKDKILADKITYEGNYYQVNSTFYKTMTLFSDYVVYLVNSDPKDLTSLTFNAWDCNTVEENCQVIKAMPDTDPLRLLLQYVFFLLYNGS